MASEPPKIVIDWSYAHEPTDDPSDIAQHLAAGYDEGPLLVIPALGFRGLRRTEGKVFEDVMSYEAHLHRHEEDVRSDRTRISSAPRWTGLVRREGGKISHALAAIYALKLLLAAPSVKRFRSPRRKIQVAQDYLVLEGPYCSDVDLLIENIGDGLRDFKAQSPALTTTMICSPDGLLTPLVDEDD